MNDSFWDDNLFLISLSVTDDFVFLPERSCGLKEKVHFLKFSSVPSFFHFLKACFGCLWSLAFFFGENLAPLQCPHFSAESNLTVLFIILEQDESSLCVSF